MDSYSRSPNFWERKITIFFIASSVLLFLLINFGLYIQKSKAVSNSADLANVLSKEGLVLLEKNTLISISNPANPEPKVVKKIPVIVTAYSSSPWETDRDPYITAAGTWVRDGVIANNLLPFGTKVKMPEIYGEKVFVVEDRMSWKKGYYHIDIWFSSYWQAKNFGAKRTYIEVLEG